MEINKIFTFGKSRENVSSNLLLFYYFSSSDNLTISKFLLQDKLQLYISGTLITLNCSKLLLYMTDHLRWKSFTVHTQNLICMKENFWGHQQFKSRLANRQHVTHPTIFKSHPIPFPVKDAFSQKLTHEGSCKYKPTIVLASCLWFHSIAMPRKLQFGIQFHWHCQWQCIQVLCHAFLIACYSCQHAICDCLSENPPSSHLPVFQEIPF